MFGGIIVSIIEALLPILLKFIGSVHPTASRAVKRQWVVDAIAELVDELDHFIPFFLRPAEGMLEKLVADAVDKLLDKAEGKIEV